jgi:hypothetical protein
MPASILSTPDPGPKKPGDSDGGPASKKIINEQEKIVNEQEQAKVSNAQQPVNGESSDENDQRDVLINPAFIDDASHHPETVTPELIEEERKEESGINP